MLANSAQRSALASAEDQNFFEIAKNYQKAIEQARYGEEEYQLNFIEYFGLQTANAGGLNQQAKPILEYTDGLTAEQLDKFGYNAKNYLLAMRYYHYTYKSLPGQEQERLDKALDLYPRAHELSPTRPHIQQEAGLLYRNKYNLYIEAGDTEKARESAEKGEQYLKEGIALNPEVVESHINLIMFYLNTDQSDKIDQVIADMEQIGVNYKAERHLLRLKNLAITNNAYNWAARFAESYAELNPDNPDAWIDAALAHAYADNRERALEIAERLRNFGPDLQEQVEVFIERVKSGYYLENRPE